MSNVNGGSAYPCAGSEQNSPVQGMSLRDYFAAKAMQRLAGGLGRLQRKGVSAEEATEYMARASYVIADAMLKERK